MEKSGACWNHIPPFWICPGHLKKGSTIVNLPYGLCRIPLPLHILVGTSAGKPAEGSGVLGWHSMNAPFITE